MHGGACWQALTDTAQRPGCEDWVLIARAGRDGASMTPRGEFDPGDSYGLLDIVTRNGCSYIAVRADPDVPADDGSGWMLLASRGEKGAQGKAGPRGAKGDKGDTVRPTHGRSTTNVSEFRCCWRTRRSLRRWN